MSYPGWQAIRAIERGEQEVEYWLPFQACLTPAERSRIAHGDVGSIIRPLKPEWEPAKGEEWPWLDVASNVQLQPKPAVFRRGSYRVAFTLRDFRPHFMRRAPHDREPSKPKRRKNEPSERYAERVTAWREQRAKPPTADVIEAARVDGNYTSAYVLAVPESEEEVENRHLERFTAEAHSRDEIRELVEHPERVQERDLLRKQNKLRKLQAEAKRLRVDISPELNAAIEAVQRKIRTGREAA